MAGGRLANTQPHCFWNANGFLRQLSHARSAALLESSLFSSLFPMSSVWTVSSHWDECCGRSTFPTKAVIHSVSLQYFQSSQQELSPLPPFIFPKFHPHFCLRLICELRLFSLLSLSSPSAGWVLVSSTFIKKQPVGQSRGGKEKPLQKKLQPSSAIPVLQWKKDPQALLVSEMGWDTPAVRNCLGRGSRAMGSAASEDETLGDCPSSTLGEDSTGKGSLHAESSHCLKLMHKQ